MNFYTYHQYIDKIIIPAFWATIRMLVITSIITITIGSLTGIILFLTNKGGLKENKAVNDSLTFIINLIRSIPSMVFIVAIAPLTRLVVGTIIGEKAAILPLVLLTIPFTANIVDNALVTVDKEIINSARSYGATDWQIVFRVVGVQAFPEIVRGLTLVCINILNVSVIAGAVGAGGIGTAALNHGYYSFNNEVLYTCVIILFIMTLGLQYCGRLLYRNVKKS